MSLAALDLDSVKSIAEIAFNIIASLAALAAAFKYVVLSGGPRRHTEIVLNPVVVHSDASSRAVEVGVRIDNKGIQLLEIYNIFLNACEVNAQGERGEWSWQCPNQITVSDEKMWLHANTGHNMVVMVPVPANVELVVFELVVPYVQKRLPASLTAEQTARSYDYNSIQKYFSPAKAV